MRIVHITENPIAGAPWNLNHAINTYTEHSSRLIAAQAGNQDRVFPSDIIIDNSSYDIIHNIIQEADVIHLHNFYDNQHLFRKYPDLWPLVMSKPRVWQAHTQRDCKWVSFETPLADKSMKHLVIAQYHPRQYPECQIVPNIIDIWDRKYRPIRNENLIPHVVYSPSNQNLSGWDDKGYAETKPVLTYLASNSIITHDMIINVPHEDCMLRKAYGNIGIDEIKTGSYHLCSLENLSLGLANIAYLDDLTLQAIETVTGTKENPWFNTRATNLQHKIVEIACDRGAMRQHQDNSRAWMEKYWDPKVLVNQFIDIYKQR
jgi:hypothetical protein